MTFHVDYETPPPPTRSTWRSPKVVALAVTIALVAGLAYYLGTRNNTPGSSGAGTIAPPISAGPGTSAGLPRGEARAGTGGRKKIYDVPIGYTRDQTGAVQAATNYTVAQTGVSYFVRQSRHEIQRYIYATDAAATPVSDEKASQTANGLGVNESGQVVDPKTGEVNQQLAFYANCYPVYGAYNVVPGGQDITRVRIWMPCIAGPASDDDTQNLRIGWMLADVSVKWSNGDWRIYDHKVQTGPSPSNVASWRDVNVSYKERERLVRDPKMSSPEGAGWTLYANATEAPLPYLGGQP